MYHVKIKIAPETTKNYPGSTFLCDKSHVKPEKAPKYSLAKRPIVILLLTANARKRVLQIIFPSIVCDMKISIALIFAGTYLSNLNIL